MVAVAPIAPGESIQRGRSRERQLRDRLGIPGAAEHVLIFAETSHWDPNWLHTSDEYFDLRVKHTLDAALGVLEAEPARVFSVECIFFLRMYWERVPERREELRERINAGRIRLSGTGITTPDTTLPVEEAIVRDYLSGRQWLRSHGMTADPSVAYLPDNFGNSPALPAILRAMGVRYAAMSRIDGMHFPGDDFRGAGFYPRPGSSARTLDDLGTLDFTWRGPDGSEVLCHWNAFTYFQGDMLAWRGIIRWMNRVFGWRDRSAGHVAGKIAGYARRLLRVSRTPYLFCPIGCDFNDPIPDLSGLLDRYNDESFPRTGVYAVNASLEDYLDLVAEHRHRLPILELDPNPYWMGFYASRPQLKQRCRKLTNTLLSTEKLLAASPGAVVEAQSLVRDGWDRLIVSNHHDFITGTAPGRVYLLEQDGWLREAEQMAASALQMATAAWPDHAREAPEGPPQYELKDGRLEVRTRWYRVVIDEAVGGCVTEWTVPGASRNLVRTPSNDLVVHRDTGGLWRMGHEYRGGSFDAIDRVSRHRATLTVEPHAGMIEVTIEALLDKHPTVRTLWFASDSPVVRMRMLGVAGRRRTVTCRFHPAVRPDGLAMDVPGGVVARDFGKGHAPTFWAASSFVHVVDREDSRGMAAFLGGPGCVTADSSGAIEWVVLRNAPREMAWRLIPVPAHPAWGANDEQHGIDYAVWFTETGDWRANSLPMAAEEALAPMGCATKHVRQAARQLLITPPEVLLRAIKPAEDGRGRIVRLLAYGHEPIAMQLVDPALSRVILCDALERDLSEVVVQERSFTLTPVGAIVSFRLLP
ncbi:MAG: hypothetical protein HY898_31315 [Deltaproteobacteria bacterium]|nr:hypothetical protein [Deltaproteobacteria bacterium]